MHRALVLFATVGLLAGVACSSGKSEAEKDAKGATEATEKHVGEKGEGAGEKGEKGEKVVKLSEAAARTAALLVEPVRTEAASAAAGGVEVPADVEADPSRVAFISSRAAGRVERLFAVVGDHVTAGQVVAHLYSPALVAAQSDLVQAARRAETLAGTPDADGARALLVAARRRVEVLGVDSALIARAERGEAAPLLPVTAPFSGSVIEAPAVVGGNAEPGTPLFKIVDLSTVNVVANVPERFLSSLRLGQGAAVRLAAYAGRTFGGRISRVVDAVDPSTRTVKALIQVSNTGTIMKPGMYASVVLQLSGAAVTGASQPVLSVPAAAILSDGGERIVFVEVAPRTYERRLVLVAASASVAPGQRVIVVSGLAPGERIVVRGAFTLKAELAKASLVDEG